jgi:predicted nucleotidyltransferase
MPSLPRPLAEFWSRAEPIFLRDERLLGVMLAGSAITGEMDEYSDLDLVIVVKPEDYDEVLANHVEYPLRFDGLLSAFIGYHVGEPRLVIALFKNPLVHVDFKFVTPDTLRDRIETPVVLFERDGQLSKLLQSGSAKWPNRDPQWFEDRFWTWMHYGGVKIARGELFEAMGFLADIRRMVLGPLAARRRGRNQREIRRIEQADPEFALRLNATVASANSDQLWSALNAAIELYCDLRDDNPPADPRMAAEQVVRSWIAAESTRGTS